MKNLFTLFFILAIYSINAQINATINLETKSPEITIMTGGDNISYSLVTLPNESGYAPEGKPLLPIKFYTFIIPADKDLSNLNVVYGTSSQTILSNRVYPGQKDVSDPNLTTPFVVPDEAVYQSSSIYPTQSAFVSNISWYGVNKLVTVGIYLCRYYPTQNKFLNYSSVQFSASFISVQKPADMFCKRPTKVWSDEIAYLKTKVINSDKVEEYYAYNNSIAAIPLKSGNDVDYIIVCPDNLCSAFNEFLLWKRCKGLLAEIVPLSQIYSSQTGDEISGIYDNAGKVRQYLRTRCSENGLQYVLLIGDMSNGAIRISNGEFGTDYYFAELNGNWDANKNGIYGDDNDNVDLIPEISVGRLLATTKEEVANWINKTFIYEQNPGLGDASYLNKALFIEADEMQQDALAIKTINSLPINIKLNTTLISETPSWNAPVSTGPTGVSVINKLNEGFGYFGSTVHGGSNTFGLATNKYAVTSEDIVSYLFPENGNGLDNLTNYTKPGVYFGISCRVVPYQNTKSFDNGGWYNIGQAFTLCMGGGVAFMGGVANLHEYESGNMNVKFALGLASNTVSHQFSKLLDYANDTLQYTTMNPGWIIGSATYNRKFYFRKVHTLIGCPEMEMWNNTPLIFSGVTTSRYTNNLRVYSGGVNGATITVSSQDGVLYHETYQLQGTEISALFTNVPQDPIIVITKTNYKPYISGKTFKVSSEFIQNEIISDYSINSHNFPKIGSDVTSTKTFGPVTISPTGTLILNATDGVLIKNDFTIELGGEFIINIK